MIWLFPAALSGLALLAVPLAIHLLTRRNARRVPFPTIKFLRQSRPAAGRIRRPADLGLLMLRLAIVGVAVAAAARPLLLDPWRIVSWNDRVVRVIVIDTSPSMALADTAGQRPAERASEILAAESRTAFRAARIDGPTLDEAIPQAVRQFDRLPPARREIVVVSDFHADAVSQGTLTAVPNDIGLRLIPVGTPPAQREWVGVPMTGWRSGQWEPTIAIDRGSTSVTWRRVGPVPPNVRLALVAAPAEHKAADQALNAALSLGVPFASSDRQTVIAFGNAPRPASFGRATAPSSPWIVRALQTLRQSELLEQAVRNDDALPRRSVAPPWVSVARNSRGRDVVTSAQSGDVLLIETSAPATSVFAPALIRAVLLGRGAVSLRADKEVNRMSDADLARWQRPPGPVSPRTVPPANLVETVDSNDSRWLWVASLALLAVEGWVRGRSGQQASEDAGVQAA
jgi:hypothetical protein